MEKERSREKHTNEWRGWMGATVCGGKRDRLDFHGGTNVFEFACFLASRPVELEISSSERASTMIVPIKPPFFRKAARKLLSPPPDYLFNYFYRSSIYTSLNLSPC